MIWRAYFCSTPNKGQRVYRSK